MSVKEGSQCFMRGYGYIIVNSILYTKPKMHLIMTGRICTYVDYVHLLH